MDPVSVPTAFRAAPPIAAPQHGYLPLPRRIVRDLSDSPGAIGVAALMVRRFLAGDTTVWLSRHDLCAYDPALSYGAADRALSRIVAHIAAVRTRGRGKFGYTPAWGLVNGSPQPYNRTAPNLGCPRHVAQVRIDVRLLDLCLGRLAPHQRHRAEVRRYVPTPLLSLHDLGTYILLQAGLPAAPTASLLRLGLVRDGVVQPLPDDATVLALASQQQGQLTEAGYRHCGAVPVQATTADHTAGQALLFFAPKTLIGPLIAPLIADRSASALAHAAQDSAPQPAKMPVSAAPKGSHAVHAVHGLDADPPPTPLSGGGRQQPNCSCAAAANEQATSEQPTPITPETATASYLMSNNVRASIVQALAAMPLRDVEAAFAQARAHPHVRDVTAWAVSLLQDACRTGRSITPPERGGYVDWGALAQREQAASVEPDGQGLPREPDGHDPVLLPSGGACDVGTPCGAAPMVAEPNDTATSTARLRAALRLRVPRQQWPLVEALALQGAPADPQLVCTASGLHRSVVAQIQPLLRSVCAAVGLPPLRTILCGVASTAPVGASAHADTMPPNADDLPVPGWIPRAHWHTLPLMLQAALLGSQRAADGSVHGRTPALTRLLSARYADALRTLCEQCDQTATPTLDSDKSELALNTTGR